MISRSRHSTKDSHPHSRGDGRRCSCHHIKPPALAEVAGGAALLVNPESVEEIGEAMCSLAGDERLRSELSAKGQERRQGNGRGRKRCANLGCVSGNTVESARFFVDRNFQRAQELWSWVVNLICRCLKRAGPCGVFFS